MISLNNAKPGDRVRVVRTYEGVVTGDDGWITITHDDGRRWSFPKGDEIDTKVEVTSSRYVVGSVYVDKGGVAWVVADTANGPLLANTAGNFRFLSKETLQGFKLIYTPGQP